MPTPKSRTGHLRLFLAGAALVASVFVLSYVPAVVVDLWHRFRPPATWSYTQQLCSAPRILRFAHEVGVVNLLLALAAIVFVVTGLARRWTFAPRTRDRLRLGADIAAHAQALSATVILGITAYSWARKETLLPAWVRDMSNPLVRDIVVEDHMAALFAAALAAMGATLWWLSRRKLRAADLV